MMCSQQLVEAVLPTKVLNEFKTPLTLKEQICKEYELKVCVRQRRDEAACKVFGDILDSGPVCVHGDKQFYSFVRKLYKNHMKLILKPVRHGWKILLKYSKFLLSFDEDIKCIRYFRRALEFYKYFLGYCKISEANGIFEQDFVDPEDPQAFLKKVIAIYNRTSSLNSLQNNLLQLRQLMQTKSDHMQDVVLLSMTIADIYFMQQDFRNALLEYRTLLRLVSANEVMLTKIPKIMEAIGKCHEKLGDIGMALKTFEKMFYDNASLIVKIDALYFLGKCFYNSKDFKTAQWILMDLIGQLVKNYHVCQKSLYLEFDHLQEVMKLINDCHVKLGTKKASNDLTWWTEAKDDEYFVQIPSIIEKVVKGFSIPLAYDRLLDLTEAWTLHLKGSSFHFDNWKIYDAKSKCVLNEYTSIAMVDDRRHKAMLQLEKAIECSKDENYVKEARCDLSGLYYDLKLLDEAIDVGETVDCKDGLLRQASMLIEKKRPQQALDFIAKIFSTYPRSNEAKKFLEKCMALKIECHILLQETTQALKSIQILDAKRSVMMTYMLKGLVMMRTGKHLEAQNCFVQADIEYQKAYQEEQESLLEETDQALKSMPTIYAKGPVVMGSLLKADSSDDQSITNLIFLVLNSTILDYSVNDYLRRLFREFSDRSYLLKWSLRFCNEEEIRIFENLFYSYAKLNQKKLGFMLYRNSLKMSLMFERARFRL